MVVVVPGSGAAVVVVVVGGAVVVVGAAVVVGAVDVVVVIGAEVVVGADVVAGAAVVVGARVGAGASVVVVVDDDVVDSAALSGSATSWATSVTGGLVCATGAVRSWLATAAAAMRPDATGGSTTPFAVADVSTGSLENAAKPIIASSKMTTTNAAGERFRTARGSALGCWAH